MELEYQDYIFLLIFVLLFILWGGLWYLLKPKLVDPFPSDIFIIIIVIMIIYPIMLESLKNDCKSVNCNK